MTSETPSGADHQTRDGAPPDDGPLAGPPGPSAETHREAPSGLPEDAPEGAPLGAQESAPEGDGPPRRGPEHMPGIPTRGEPPTSG